MLNYTHGNARTRSLYDARVSGRKVPLLLRGSDTKDRKGNGQTYLTVKDGRSLTPDEGPQADRFWREKRRRSSQPSPHTLLYLELPRGQPIRIRTEGQQPRRDWRKRVYLRKKSIHGEWDSPVGEDKAKIKNKDFF